MSGSALPPFPRGWFVAARADELPHGGVITRPFMDAEVSLYRTGSGDVHATASTCPHPSKGVRNLPLIERHGFLLVHHAADGRPPDDEIPDIDLAGWTRLRHRAWTLRAHPQETSENSVDVGHLGIVHGYRAVKQLARLHLDGPYLRARYAFERRVGPTQLVIQSEFTVHLHGLGYSRVDAMVPRLGFETRQFVFNTPIDEERSILRIALLVRRTHDGQVPRLMRAVPLSLLASAVMVGFANDIGQDFELWRHKIHVASPCLAEGDGPIGHYRRWARQFYAQHEDARHFPSERRLRT